MFEATGCEGLARVDFFVDGERVLVNELNTMPGFTPTSVYAKLLDASGVPYPRLLDRLCRLALERHAARARTASERRPPVRRAVQRSTGRYLNSVSSAIVADSMPGGSVVSHTR